MNLDVSNTTFPNVPRLIETRVVFEFRFKVVSNLPQARLIETRVVFESVIKIINAYVKID